MMCFACQSVCPTGAIQATEQGVFVNQGVCNACGTCVRFCPVQAIQPVTEDVGVEAGTKSVAQPARNFAQNQSLDSRDGNDEAPFPFRSPAAGPIWGMSGGRRRQHRRGRS